MEPENNLGSDGRVIENSLSSVLENGDNDAETSGTNGHVLPSKVLILRSEAKREYFATEEHYLTESFSEENANIIVGYVEKLGISTHCIPANRNLTEEIQKYQPELIINLVDSVRGKEHLAATIPALCELLEIPYTGSGTLGMAMSYNKFLVNMLLSQAGIPVPKSQLFHTHNDFIDPTLKYPLICKLNEIHGSLEISLDAIAINERQLRDRVKYLTEIYKQPVLAQEFIVGKEVAVFVVEGSNRKVYSVEKVFHDDKNIFQLVSFDNWQDTGWNNYHLEKYYDENIKNIVKKAYDLMKYSDYAKFDIRIDSSGRYYIIDANDNPALGPKEADFEFGYCLDLYGVSFETGLKRLLSHAMSTKKYF